MRTTKKSTPANDSVNRSYIKAVSTKQIRAVVKFLPILESIKPEDLERAVKSQELATDSLEVGRYEYHQPSTNSCRLAMKTGLYNGHSTGQLGLKRGPRT